MLGSGKSSLAIWTAFNTMATATVRLLKWVLKIAWKRAELSSQWATVGSSLINGIDMVQGQSSIISKPDLFYYYDESDRAVKIEYTRELLEPMGGVALGQTDISLENTDGRFTPNKGLTCGTALYPNRPMIIQLGFEVGGVDKTIPVFKGLSDQPKENKINRLLNIHAYDYLKYLNQYELETSIYVDQRSDQIISGILTDVGFSVDQFILDEGLNTIGYAGFEKGTKAGNAIKKICEAEEGFFYQDEEGILRFENRRKYNILPFTQTQWTIKSDDIIEWIEDSSVAVVNRCIVKAKPRVVKASTEIYRNMITEELQHNSVTELWVNFENPITSFSNPVATTDYLGNSQNDGGGSDLTSYISINFTGFTTTAKLLITNSYPGIVYLTYLRVRGTPAIITHEINELYQDDDSVSKYSRQQLEIENDYIDSETFAYYLARAIVRKYKSPMKRVKIKIRGVPTLQLRDKISVYDKDLDNYISYRIMKIVGVLYQAGFYQTLTLREITSFEADAWATIGYSTIEGNDVVGI